MLSSTSSSNIWPGVRVLGSSLKAAHPDASASATDKAIHVKIVRESGVRQDKSFILVAVVAVLVLSRTRKAVFHVEGAANPSHARAVVSLHDADDVKSARCITPGRVCAQIVRSGAPEAVLLDRSHAFAGRRKVPGGAAHPHFDEHQSAGAARNDIDLTVTATIVALKDSKAAAP